MFYREFRKNLMGYDVGYGDGASFNDFSPRYVEKKNARLCPTAGRTFGFFII